jgi:hypothetical protein
VIVTVLSSSAGAAGVPAAARHLALCCRVSIVDVYRRLFPMYPVPPRDLAFNTPAWVLYLEEKQAAAQLYYRRDCGGMQRGAWVRVSKHLVPKQQQLRGMAALTKPLPSPKPRMPGRTMSAAMPSLGALRLATTITAAEEKQPREEVDEAPTSPLLSLLRR